MCALRIQLKAATNRLLEEREREVNANKQIQELSLSERENQEKQQKKINKLINNLDKYTLSSDNEKTKRKIREKESLLAQLTIDIQSLDQNEASQNCINESKLESAESMLDYLKNKYESQIETKNSTAEMLKQLHTEFSRLENQIESYAKKISRLQTKENEILEKIEKRKAEEYLENQRKEKYNNEIINIDDKIEVLRNEIELARKVCKKKQQENQINIDEANRKLKEATRTRERYEKQHKKLSDKIFDLNGQLSFISAELNHISVAKHNYVQPF